MDSLTRSFLVGLTDELEKGGMSCGTSGKKLRSKGEGKGLALGKGKGPMGMPKKATSISEKIQAAKADPSTKANPHDRGPKGSGTQDPRFKAMKKQAWGGGKAKADELNKHIIAAGGSVSAGVKSYNDAKKGKKGKKDLSKKGEESFISGFDEGMGKDGGIRSSLKRLAKSPAVQGLKQKAGAMADAGIRKGIDKASKNPKLVSMGKGVVKGLESLKKKAVEDAFFAGFAKDAEFEPGSIGDKAVRGARAAKRGIKRVGKKAARHAGGKVKHVVEGINAMAEAVPTIKKDVKRSAVRGLKRLGGKSKDLINAAVAKRKLRGKEIGPVFGK